MCDFDDGFLADVLEGGGAMEYDYSVLRGKIRDLYGSEKAFASAIGMASATLSMKLNNRREFTQGEIRKIMDALHEDRAMASRYFFTLKHTVA